MCRQEGSYGSKALWEQRDRSESIRFPFSWIELNPEGAVAGVGAWARSGLNCVGSQFVQTGNERFHTFPPCEKHMAFVCSSREPHLRQWTRGGSADSASKSSSTDGTTVNEIDGDLSTMTGLLWK